ncbi:hypothetical protein ACFL5K_02565 [Gemmatimonadota bacterium]
MADLGVEFQAVRPLWLLLLPGAALLVVWWTYRKTYPPVGTGYRLLLLALRMAVVVLAGMLLFEPVVSLTRFRSRPERIAVLADRSASMLLPASRDGGGENRFSTALKFVGKLLGETSVEKKLFVFGGELTATDSLDAPLTEVEDRTDLHAALEQLVSTGTSRWDRIYLISDGCINSGAEPSSVFETAAGGMPAVEAVLVGETPGLPDLALVGIESLGGRVFAGEQIELELSIALNMPVGHETQERNKMTTVADIFIDNRKVAEKRISLEMSSSRFVGTRVRVDAGEPGYKFLRVALRPLAQEWTALNNERSLFVEVVKSKRKIVLVSNKPDWDLSFLRQAMLLNEDWEVESLIMLRSDEAGDFIRRLDKTGRYSTGPPLSTAELQEAELVVLHGELTNYNSGFLSLLAGRAVKGGLGILFWPTGKLNQSAVPGTLTAYLPFKGKLPVGFDQVSGRQQQSAVFTLDRYNVLAGLGGGEPLDNLPPLEMVYPPVPLKDGAEVLARIIEDKHRKSVFGPALVVQPVRRSRVATILGRGLWRWHMLGQTSDKKRDTMYYNLWEELIEWLLSGEKSEDFTLKPVKPVFSLGEEVRLEGFDQKAGKDDGVIDTSQTIEVIVLSRNEQEDTVAVTEVERLDAQGKFIVELGRLAAGIYHYRGVSSGSKAEGKFAVERYSPEWVYQEPDTTALAGLAELTGGSITVVSELDGLIGSDEKTDVQVKAFQLSTSGWLYFMLVAILAAEWILRRRKSLA